MYWGPRDPRKCLSPDVFLRMSSADEPFETWNVWKRGAPDIDGLLTQEGAVLGGDGGDGTPGLPGQGGGGGGASFGKAIVCGGAPPGGAGGGSGGTGGCGGRGGKGGQAGGANIGLAVRGEGVELRGQGVGAGGGIQSGCPGGSGGNGGNGGYGSGGRGGDSVAVAEVGLGNVNLLGHSQKLFGASGPGGDGGSSGALSPRWSRRWNTAYLNSPVWLVARTRGRAAKIRDPISCRVRSRLSRCWGRNESSKDDRPKEYRPPTIEEVVVEQTSFLRRVLRQFGVRAGDADDVMQGGATTRWPSRRRSGPRRAEGHERGALDVRVAATFGGRESELLAGAVDTGQGPAARVEVFVAGRAGRLAPGGGRDAVVG